MRCHVSCSFGSHLSTEVCFRTAMCPAALDLTSLAEVSSGTTTWPVASGLVSLLSWAPAPPHVPQLWTSLPCWGGLRRCHVAPALPPREESSGAVTYPTTPSGLWTTGIKKDLATPATQLSSHVSKARSRVTEAKECKKEVGTYGEISKWT
jgi:hypothetical protein